MTEEKKVKPADAKGSGVAKKVIKEELRKEVEKSEVPAEEPLGPLDFDPEDIHGDFPVDRDGTTLKIIEAFKRAMDKHEALQREMKKALIDAGEDPALVDEFIQSAE